MFGFFDDDEDPQRELFQTLLEASSECIEDGGGQRATALALLNFAVGAAFLVFTEDELLKSMAHAFQREQRDKGRGGDRMATIFKPEESATDADTGPNALATALRSLRATPPAEVNAERCTVESSDGWRCKRAVHEDDRHDFINEG